MKYYEQFHAQNIANDCRFGKKCYILHMAKYVPEWRDAPYFYEDGKYYAERGGIPRDTPEEAYADRYREDIAAGRKPSDPYRQGCPYGLTMLLIFVTVVAMLADLLLH